MSDAVRHAGIPRPQRLALAAAVGAAARARPADQVADRPVLELHESHHVLPVLDIMHAHNPGAAFSFLADAGGWQRWLFTLLAVGVSGVHHLLAAASSTVARSALHAPGWR